MNCTYTHLCESERYMIVSGLQAGHNIRQIARNIQRSVSTISRELRRHHSDQGYDALLAHQQAKAKRHKPRIIKKLCAHSHLRMYVFGKLGKCWSAVYCSKTSLNVRRCGFYTKLSTPIFMPCLNLV